MIITIGSTLKDDKGNNYVLDSILGSGGFGNVYKAHNENDGSVVAIKLLQNTFDSNDAYLSFQKETNQSKLIDSENVIKYLFIHDGKLFPEYPPYIIMEYTDGGTLRQFIKERNGQQLDIETLKDIFIQLTNGMKAVSEHLVHRDIKPENILNFSGTLKITDFGLSKISVDSTKTLSFKNAGTPLYIAPEAWNNDKNTIQMDIYSMGIVFYELATLSFPYDLPEKQKYESFKNMHLFDAVNNPATINPNLPPNIVSMIIKMLEKPTQNRFKNWDEIISVLKTKSLPKDDISEFVNSALNKRNERQLSWQKTQAEKERAESKRKDYIQLVYSQFSNAVLDPINEFINRFNTQIEEADRRIKITSLKPLGNTCHFKTEIKMPIGHIITLYCEILFKENFTKEVETFFGRGTKTINYLPQCNNIDIIMWCQVKDNDSLGFNLLLLKNEGSMYGDWFILENTLSAFSHENRPSPFGFSLSELPEEINLINAVHIYNSDLSPYNKYKILQFIADRV